MMAQERTSGNTPDEGYVPTYYPGTNDPMGAVAIELGLAKKAERRSLANFLNRFVITASFENHVAELSENCSNNAPDTGIIMYQ